MKGEYYNSDLAHRIDEVIHSKRDRGILKDRYIDGEGLEDLAAKYHVSVSTIKNVLYKGKLKIF